jgi:hypothetical protein
VLEAAVLAVADATEKPLRMVVQEAV